MARAGRHGEHLRPKSAWASVALIARYLIDTRAAARMGHRGVARRLRPLIGGGVIATTASLDDEALYSARGPDDYEQIHADRRTAATK